jgi:hypothetical protein
MGQIVNPFHEQKNVCSPNVPDRFFGPATLLFDCYGGIFKWG